MKGTSTWEEFIRTGSTKCLVFEPKIDLEIRKFIFRNLLTYNVYEIRGAP